MHKLRLLLAFMATSLVSLAGGSPTANETGPYPVLDEVRPHVLAPKIFIISMFAPETNVWFNIPEFNILARNISVPGFPPLFPSAHCTADASICLLTTAPGEINAGVTITALLHSPLFDLTRTYFMIAGIAGISPRFGTTGSVTFARYAVQVALQYEIDAREIPSSFATGYVGQGTKAPGEYPSQLYGTEVFAVNDVLQDIAFTFAQKARLHDNDQAKAFRQHFANATDKFAPAVAAPSVIKCDTATADTFWMGTLLAEAFENTTNLWTNGTGKYCTTQQEDNATLESLLRGALSHLVDFSRIIIMRTGSDFDRTPPEMEAASLLDLDIQGGFVSSVENLHRVGVEVIKGIIGGWDAKFKKGIKPTKYIGDIWGSLGGEPNFGPGSAFGGKGSLDRRSLAMGRKRWLRN